MEKRSLTEFASLMHQESGSWMIALEKNSADQDVRFQLIGFYTHLFEVKCHQIPLAKEPDTE